MSARLRPAAMLLCAVLGAPAMAGEANPARAGASITASAPALYVRGGFNGWGTANALLDQGGGIYTARIDIRPGFHGFKIGSADWAVTWVADGDASITVDPGHSYRLPVHAGPEEHLLVRRPGSYLFRLDLHDAAAPQLRVEREGDGTASTATIDPHRGHGAVSTWRWPGADGRPASARFSIGVPAPMAAGAGGVHAAAARHYTISTSESLREAGPPWVSVAEAAAGDGPTVRSGSVAFDALFALAAQEMRQDAVDAITDGNYNGGAAIACACFETGEQWHYVWTRDLSYAADLGLAVLAPQRVMRSLEFKLSPWRDGVSKPAAAAGSADGLQILQDTGSGGSWPVSTDRVAWAFGAARVLPLLPAAARADFAPRALHALVNTIENDRLAAFDPADGLYRGEASFLDWRDQSYAAWIVDDLASLASAKALSTNLAHYQALRLAAQLADARQQAPMARRYADWAARLKAAINARFWLADAGMYASLSGPHFDGAPLHKFDWLGQSLAIVTGVADAARSRSILAHYPHGPRGAPVIYPQQPQQPIYHNRAIWPFVTAYGLRAAAIGGNVAVADAAYATLMRSAALNLSNMENLEWVSGKPLLLDEASPALSGPVINSRRQLWSVGAYLGMVIESVFGVATDQAGLTLRPFITSALRRNYLGDSRRLVLRDLPLRGGSVDVSIELPPPSVADGYYRVASISVDGKPAGSRIAWAALGAHSRIVVRLGALARGQQALTRVDGSADVAPPAPRLSATAPGRLSIGAGADAKARTRYNLYRDGVLLAGGLVAGEHAIAADDGCYAAEAVADKTVGDKAVAGKTVAASAVAGQRRLYSHHSRPLCLGEAIVIAAGDPRMDSNVAASGTPARLAGWGAPGDRWRVAITIAKPGRYQLQLGYANTLNQINLGITSGVKQMTVFDGAGAIVARGVIVLPHTRAGAGAGADNDQAGLAGRPAPGWSTPLPAQLAAGHYSVQLDDFYNMSYLAANRSFSGAGGVDGAANRFDLLALRLRKTDHAADANKASAAPPAASPTAPQP